MNKENISKVISGISLHHINEADSYPVACRRNISRSFWAKAPLAAVLIVCLLIGSLTFTAVELKEWSSSVTFKDGSTVSIAQGVNFKKISDTAPKTDMNSDDNRYISMTNLQVSDALGFPVLNYEAAENTSISYRTELNKNGRIGRVDLWWAGILQESEEKSLCMSISMLNENADEGYIDAFRSGLDAAGGKELENITYISINGNDTKVVFYYNDWSSSRINATFVYDDVLYNLIGDGYSRSDVEAVIAAFK